MTIKTFKYPALLLTAVIGLAGCPGDDTGSNTSDTDPTSGPSSSATMSSGPSSSGPTTDTETATTMDTDPTVTDTDASSSSSTGPDQMAFEFRDDPPDAYTQIDRMGLPGINTALIEMANKDAYNADSPGNRLSDYETDIGNSLSLLHRGGGPAAAGFGLDDDLENAGFTPCTVGIASTCEQQVAPLFAAGDQLHVDTAAAAGFPNGRRPSDAVMDLVLGAVLLEVGTDGQTGAELAAIPLNPTENPEGFPKGFPYFQAAN